MEFSVGIFFVVFFVNAGYMGVMWIAQQMDRNLPEWDSIIPRTKQKFLRMQDFNTTSWGDFLAVPLIASAFLHLAINGHIDPWQWLVFENIVIVDGLGFLLMCLRKKHKPDQGFPSLGRVSWHGLSHLPYHGVGVAMFALSVWHSFTGELFGLTLYVGVAGVILYATTFIADIKAGNFADLKEKPELQHEVPYIYSLKGSISISRIWLAVKICFHMVLCCFSPSAVGAMPWIATAIEEKHYKKWGKK